MLMAYGSISTTVIQKHIGFYFRSYHEGQSQEETVISSSSDDDEPIVVAPANSPRTMNEWVSGSTDPDYRPFEPRTMNEWAAGHFMPLEKPSTEDESTEPADDEGPTPSGSNQDEGLWVPVQEAQYFPATVPTWPDEVVGALEREVIEIGSGEEACDEADEHQREFLFNSSEMHFT